MGVAAWVERVMGVGVETRKGSLSGERVGVETLLEVDMERSSSMGGFMPSSV